MYNYVPFLCLLWLKIGASFAQTSKGINTQDYNKLLYKHFAADVFDHIVFLHDKDDFLLEDTLIEDYQQLSAQFKSFYTFININQKNFNSHRISKRKQLPSKFPVLYHISIPSCNSLNGFELFQNQSSADLSNNVWLIKVHSIDDKDEMMEQVSMQIQSLMPNLAVDSRVFLILPDKFNCDDLNMYEVYKVSVEALRLLTQLEVTLT